MDPVPARHGQTYGLQVDGHNTYPIDAQSVPRTISGASGAQNMETQGYSGLNNAQGWPQRALDEMKDMFLLLGTDRRIMYASVSCKLITGYTAKQLEGKPLSNFIHQADQAILSHEIDECVATGSSLRLHLRFKQTSDSFCILEACGHPHISAGGGSSENERHCDGVFLMCRPYPTKSAQLLDSFLEHKMENTRLMQQIARLKDEEEEELNASRQPFPKPDQLNSKNLYNSNRFAASHATGFPGPSAPDGTTSTEDYESSDTITNFDEPDLPSSLTEDLSHIEGIEMMTGLHYGEGERSQGISTGTHHGCLVQCDTTDVPPVDPQPAQNNTSIMEESDRRKRLKGEYQCADCGTSDSPEWRKGPRGPKTLCNACGCKIGSLPGIYAFLCLS